MFPSAEHRFCVRHIHENMNKKWKGERYKDCLWRCATATTVIEFNKGMDEMKKLSVGSHDWLKKISPEHWSRSHFTGIIQIYKSTSVIYLFLI